MHPEIVGALREFLLRNKVLTADEERSLYSIALENPCHCYYISTQIKTQNTPHEHLMRLIFQTRPWRQESNTLLNVDAWLSWNTNSLATFYQVCQVFSRVSTDPSIRGCSEWYVPLPPHSLAPMASATAAIFGVPGIGLPEGQMVPPVSNSSFVSASNNDGFPPVRHRPPQLIQYMLPWDPPIMGGMGFKRSSRRMNSLVLTTK
ncbi:hypothetical protein BSL78_26965 [Apostichopus japonicus]|uniref:Uncharacterized protein n=1 Tax=Stichopus japonicus TaxID=307972 RepID=A0A2G8JKC5_STIJA|nr:hypothetical protein BSL78_26965 [Apostichopus japonicus]